MLVLRKSKERHDLALFQMDSSLTTHLLWASHTGKSLGASDPTSATWESSCVFKDYLDLRMKNKGTMQLIQVFGHLSLLSL